MRALALSTAMLLGLFISSDASAAVVRVGRVAVRTAPRARVAVRHPVVHRPSIQRPVVTPVVPAAPTVRSTIRDHRRDLWLDYLESLGY